MVLKKESLGYYWMNMLVKDNNFKKRFQSSLVACFDFDHTLFEYRPPREEILARLLQEEGLEITPSRILMEEFLLRTRPPLDYQVLIKRWPLADQKEREKIIFLGRRILMRRLFPQLAPDIVNSLARKLVDFSSSLMRYLPVPELKFVLQSLKNLEIPLVINSGNVSDIILEHLREHDLEQYFDDIFAVDTHEPRKKDNFRHVMRRYLENGGGIVHVGDEPNTDYFVPRTYGIASYLVIRSPLLDSYARELYAISERDIFQNLNQYLKHLKNSFLTAPLFFWGSNNF